jgi:hypothetical protein
LRRSAVSAGVEGIGVHHAERRSAVGAVGLDITNPPAAARIGISEQFAECKVR